MIGDPSFRTGSRIMLGTHHFTAKAIIAFAKKYDPQPFHLDAEAARNSLFGGLCASGWHTASVWMRLNVEEIGRHFAELAAQGRALPEFGPSPGIRNLRWLRPVFADSTIGFARIVRELRDFPSRRDWSVLESTAEAWNECNEPVMSFESSVLIRLPAAQGD